MDNALTASEPSSPQGANYSDGWIPDNHYGIDNGAYPGDFGMVDPGIYWIWEPS